jgi:hypothetical protein
MGTDEFANLAEGGRCGLAIFLAARLNDEFYRLPSEAVDELRPNNDGEVSQGRCRQRRQSEQSRSPP